MPTDPPNSTLGEGRLIAIPALVSLAMTVLRLAGEIGRWSERWFEPVTRGIRPSSFGWMFGITWLPVPFGIYFALRLAVAGRRPASAGKACGYALAGVV